MPREAWLSRVMPSTTFRVRVGGEDLRARVRAPGRGEDDLGVAVDGLEVPRGEDAPPVRAPRRRVPPLAPQGEAEVLRLVQHQVVRARLGRGVLADVRGADAVLLAPHARVAGGHRRQRLVDDARRRRVREDGPHRAAVREDGVDGEVHRPREAAHAEVHEDDEDLGPALLHLVHLLLEAHVVALDDHHVDVFHLPQLVVAAGADAEHALDVRAVEQRLLHAEGRDLTAGGVPVVAAERLAVEHHVERPASRDGVGLAGARVVRRARQALLDARLLVDATAYAADGVALLQRAREPGELLRVGLHALDEGLRV
mmetsp:Transcript_35929/g.112807  ORF Transcript_35929/g.112807 Transcript_35929/m.112807 type:complete len:313 (-) Transcript_35929:2414-3352(-)